MQEGTRMSRDMGKTQTAVGIRLGEGSDVLPLTIQGELLWKMWTALAKSLPFSCEILQQVLSLSELSLNVKQG